MKLAAVDIGSNAVRLQISQVNDDIKQPVLKTLEYIRFPLSLGQEVFSHQYISEQGENKLQKLLRAFQLLIELYQVSAYRIYATSAWREATNKWEVKERLEQLLNLTIYVVDGQEEAAIINQAIQAYIQVEEYFHIDVGGGSTELSYYQHNTAVAIRSFPLGALKNNTTAVAQRILVEMKEWIHEHNQRFSSNVLGIATGGNIRKLVQLTQNSSKKMIPLKKLVAMQKELSRYTWEERMKKYDLNPNRAMNILPAVDIYLQVLHWVGIKQILVPPIGLRDGIVQALFKEYHPTLLHKDTYE